MFLSLGIIISHVILIYMIRRKLDKTVDDGSVKDILLDGLFAFELGCLAQEQGIILQNYGILPWSFCLFCVVVWQVVAWPDRSSSPVPHILTFKVWGFFRTGIMLAASLMSYRYMGIIWEFGMSELHLGRVAKTSLDHCHFPFKHTSIALLVFSEFVGSIFLGMACEKILTNDKVINNDPNRYLRGLLIGFLVVAAVVLGMDVSGAMYNPTLATLLLGGCAGHTTLEHVIVYWISPTAGAWAAKKILHPQQQTKTKSSTKLKSPKKLKSN